MRLRLAWVLFILAGLAAGCGGGGKSGVVPSLAFTGSGAPSTSAPSSAKTTRANISLYIPPANKQDSRKPLYVPSNTQALGVFVEAYPSVLPSFGPSSTPPPGLQIIPVATPSPCAPASAGGETCTLTVTAPVGTDLFVVAAFASPSPNPSGGPLAAFVSGPIVVSLSPSPGASPLAFTLNGVVNSVAVAVNSPDPGNTPNTQVFTVGVPATAAVALTAYDSSGNAILSSATTPYFNPIVIQASPASEGLTLSLIGASGCGSSASGSTAQINCSGDLGNVQVTYDGTPRPDASDHLIDAYSVYSTTAPNPTPSPANFVLSSNILQWQLNTGTEVGSPGFLRRMGNGQFFYLVYLYSVEGWVSGTFNPSTETAGTQVPLNDGNLFSALALASDGSFWVLDSSGDLECFTSTSATAPSFTGITATNSFDNQLLDFQSLGADGSGNVWYGGWDSNFSGGGSYAAPPDFVGHFPANTCSSSPSPLVAQFGLTNGYYGSSNSPLIAVNTNGTVAATTASVYGLGQNGVYNGGWVFNSGSTSPVPVVNPLNLGGAYGDAVALDPTGNAYIAFSGGSNPADLEMLSAGASTFTELLTLAPSSSGSYPSPDPSALSAFSPSSAAADRAMYVDQDYEALTLIEGVPSSPMPILVSLPNSVYALDDAYTSSGGEYVLDMDANENLNIVRMLPTRTWSVPNVTMNTGCNSSALLTILERGDSGPFTVNTGSSGITATQLPGADHDFYLTGLSNGTFTATVTDNHGRTETFTITAASSSLTCGISKRRLVKHKQ